MLLPFRTSTGDVLGAVVTGVRLPLMLVLVVQLQLVWWLMVLLVLLLLH